MKDTIHKVVLEDEFRACPVCRYNDGFHTMLKRDEETGDVKWLFICPSCHETFEVDGLK